MNTDGTANDTAILGAMAQAALVKLGTPASPVDRPGDWGDRTILARFGASAVDELIAAGLVQRGGTPSSVPPAVEARYPQNMRLHREQIRTIADRGDLPPYPAPRDILFMTTSGWIALEELTARGVPDDRAVDDFARTLKQKMADGRARGRGGWQTCPLPALQSLLRESVEKGDPRDVATYAMMIWHNKREQMRPWQGEDVSEAVSLDFAPLGPGLGRRIDADVLDRLASTPATTDIGGSHE